MWGTRLPRALLGAVLCALVVSCDSGDRRTVAGFSGTPVPRVTDAQVVDMGRRVYGEHCARCHGAQGEGHPRWRERRPDGHYPPPPLNGTGHAWHHPLEELRAIIRDGSQTAGDMPAWRDTLTDDEIDAVIAWFQAQWPDPVYAAWYERVQYGRN